jgi:UDP-N-acetylglucosamine/UDP-N-acetylgalactosamine diphosphorylase
LTYEQAQAKLRENGQLHLLKYYDELSELSKEKLLAQIDSVPFSFDDVGTVDDDIEPIEAVSLAEIAENRETYEKIGLEAIKRGEIGAVLLAGGQGTRLGCDTAKGLVDIGITRPLYIFECLFNNLIEVVKKAGVFIPFYIMTSVINDTQTRTFLNEKNYFGYNPEYVKFFVQSSFPATDFNGKILLKSKDSLALSPNGNGGWFESMNNAGLDKDLEENNIKWLNCFAVDNVCQRIADPVFIGAVLGGKSPDGRPFDSGAKVVRKSNPAERVGVLCKRDGKPAVAEYYELSDEQMNARRPDGTLKWDNALTLNYLFALQSLKNLRGVSLPVHKVKKKIKCLDDSGNPISPEIENGYKYEILILDMVHEMNNCLPFEVLREYEFAPIKNKEGVDSIETARELLKKNGVKL